MTQHWDGLQCYARGLRKWSTIPRISEILFWEDFDGAVFTKEVMAMGRKFRGWKKTLNVDLFPALLYRCDEFHDFLNYITSAWDETLVARAECFPVKVGESFRLIVFSASSLLVNVWSITFIYVGPLLAEFILKMNLCSHFSSLNVLFAFLLNDWWSRLFFFFFDFLAIDSRWRVFAVPGWVDPNHLGFSSENNWSELFQTSRKTAALGNKVGNESDEKFVPLTWERKENLIKSWIAGIHPCRSQSERLLRHLIQTSDIPRSKVKLVFNETSHQERAKSPRSFKEPQNEARRAKRYQTLPGIGGAALCGRFWLFNLVVQQKGRQNSHELGLAEEQIRAERHTWCE